MDFVGIDIGKASLDAACTAPAPTLPRRVPNDAAGRAALVAALVALAPALVVLEATGRYHRPLLTALIAAAVPVVVANPAQVAAFRQARLGRQKTDRQDARLLARFAEVHGAELRRAAAADPLQARLRALVDYRETLVAERTRLRNRLHAAAWDGDPDVGRWLAADLAAAEARLAEVDAATARVLDELPEARVLEELPGVGPRVAAAVLAYLPPGVWGNAKAAAAYAGLHPKLAQSGQRATSKLSKQGPGLLRRHLYLAAMAAVRGDPDLAACYARLVARGKAPRSALCAVADKLLRRMMGRLRAALDQPHATPLLAAA